MSSSGGSGTVLLSVASFYGFELPLQLPIWKKQLGGPGGGGGGAPAHHSSRKGMWSMYCSPRTGAAQLTALSQQACLVMSGPFWQAGVRSPGCWEPCGQVLSRPPLGEAGTKPREGPGMASPFVPSAPEILFAWLCRKKELKKKEKEKS